MGKRAAEKQLTKDDADAGVDHDAGAGVGADGSFKKAPLDVLKKRRILKVRRTAAQPTPQKTAPEKTVPEKTAPAANPFAAVPAPSEAPAPTTAKARNPFANLPAPTPATDTTTAPAASTPAKEPASEDEPPAPAVDANAPKADADGAPIAPAEKEAPNENGVEKNLEAEEEKDDKDAENKEGETPVLAEKESKDEVKPSTDAPTAAVPEKPDADKTDNADVKVVTPKPAEGTEATIAAAPAAPEPEKKTAEPSPAVFKFSKPFVFGGTAATSVKTFADAANASKDTASIGVSNGGGGTLSGGFTFSPAAAASLSEAMKNSAGSSASTSFAGVGKPTTPAKGSFEETKVASGEEGETTVHKVRAKVFWLDSGSWRERGVGALKLNVEDKAKTARLLLRNEATLRLALNAPLYKDLKLDRAGERGIRLKDVASGTVFLVRVGSKDDAQKLVDVVEEETKKLP